MLTVTADSNIYISALVFGGLPLQFLDAARAGVFRLTISDGVLAEVLKVLRLKFLWSEEALLEAATLLASIAGRVEPTEAISVITADPDDDRILECAVAAEAGFIVSGDNHLLRLGRYRNIHILRVADFMALIRP